jgi:hypothetical protein
MVTAAVKLVEMSRLDRIRCLYSIKCSGSFINRKGRGFAVFFFHSVPPEAPNFQKGSTFKVPGEFLKTNAKESGFFPFTGPREQVCFVQSWMSRRPAVNRIGIISFASAVQQPSGTSLEIAIRESASSQREMEAAKK